jgi:hypothetical protein
MGTWLLASTRPWVQVTWTMGVLAMGCLKTWRTKRGEVACPRSHHQIEVPD